MKAIVIFLIIATFFGCNNNPVSPDIKEGETFEAWSDSLNLDDVQIMYNNGPSFMADARMIPSVAPFSYEDSVTFKGIIDTSKHYPWTTAEGITTIKYKDSLIFKNSWNNFYMEPRSMTRIYFGEPCPGFKLLKIANESAIPSGGYKRENRLFIVSSNILEEVDLPSLHISFYFNEIRLGGRTGVVIIHAVDFPRSYPNYHYYILLDLLTRKNKIFRLSYY